MALAPIHKIFPTSFPLLGLLRMLYKFDYIRKAYWGVDGIWSDGYFVSTVGVNEHVIKQYIEHQGQEDRGQAQLVLDL